MAWFSQAGFGELGAGLLLGAAIALGAPQASAEAGGPSLAQLIAAAIAEVQQGEEEGPALQALMQSLPQDVDGSFIVEGDLALSRHELLDHLAGLAPGLETTEGNPELLLATVGGLLSFYQDPDDRRLTYAIDRASFPTAERYAEMGALMDQATTDWEAVCPACSIEFQHLSESDAAPDHATVNFVVRYRDAGGLFVARAFYPHDTGSDRVLDIDPSFFSAARPKDGVLRHEIGHILGYRHEQIQGVPGCGAVGSGWVALTDYDARSIMHYFCGGGGNDQMLLSDSDRQGHRLIYQMDAP